MRKSSIGVLIAVIALIGCCLWLLQGANPKYLERQTVVTDVPDTFEK